MTLNQDTSLDPGQTDDDEDLNASSLLDLIGFNASHLGDALAHLEDIPEPSFDDLAALDNAELDDMLEDDFGLADDPPPAALSELEALADSLPVEEPEIVSLEGLDDDPLDDDEVEDFDSDDFDEIDENYYIDLELDDDDLEDEGYEDDDDDDIEDYHDLYGDDDVIITSFDDDNDDIDAYYDDLR